LLISFPLPRLYLSPSMAIVGQHQGDLVAIPSDFPQPQIDNCRCEYLEILTPNNQLTTVLCLLSDKDIFQIEETVFKVSLYGTIHRGWILERSTTSSSPASSSSSFLPKKTTEEYQIVAKKFRKIDVANLSRADDPIQEFSALQYLGNDHRHVLGQIACLCDENYYYSIMKFCDGGELCSRVLGIGPVTEHTARVLFCQLLDAMEFIQKKGIFHRDISLENILITKSSEVILIDFGMCLRLSLKGEGSREEELCDGDDAPIVIPSVPYLLPPMAAKGKKSYMAPEVVQETTPFDGFKSDIWSLGIVLFTMLTGKFIVTHASPLCQLFRHVRNGRLKDMCVHWKLGLSEEVQCLLYDMLSVDPKKRPSVAEIRKYSWCLGHGLIDGGIEVGGSVTAPGA
jgi:serine/threonine protein kinase